MLDFKDLRVLIVGDICLDVIEEGSSYRKAPEADVPVILNPTKKYSLGMAGNVATNIANLGAEVYLLTHAGDITDYNSKKILNLLNKNNIKYKLKTYNSYINNKTIVKKRIFSNNEQIARVDYEKIDCTDPNFLNFLEETLNKLYETDYFDYIIISDYNKGFINEESWSIIKPSLDKFNKNNLYFVDTKKKDVLNYYKGMYLFPNKNEMENLLEYNNLYARNELREKLNIDFIVETADKEGAFIYKDDGKIIYCLAYPTNSSFINTYGAGDVFISAFSLYYTKYKKKRKALEFANYCCSKAITKKGTCNITLEEVEDFDEQIKI